MARDVSFVFNGNKMTMTVEDHWTLLHLIREELGYTGTKEGCGSGECGACTVVVDGIPMNSCLMLAVEIDGRDVTSVEGLARRVQQLVDPDSFEELHADTRPADPLGFRWLGKSYADRVAAEQAKTGNTEAVLTGVGEALFSRGLRRLERGHFVLERTLLAGDPGQIGGWLDQAGDLPAQRRCSRIGLTRQRFSVIPDGAAATPGPERQLDAGLVLIETGVRSPAVGLVTQHQRRTILGQAAAATVPGFGLLLARVK